MSTYLYIWFISYVQTDLAKLKGSTREFESIVVIIEYSPTISYHLRRLDYASVTTDHTKNTKHPKGLKPQLHCHDFGHDGATTHPDLSSRDASAWVVVAP